MTSPIGQFSMEYCIWVSLSSSDISLPKVITILDTTKPLSFKTLVVCLHPCCSQDGPGTGRRGWNISILWPSSMQGHGNSLRWARRALRSRRDVSCRVDCSLRAQLPAGQERGCAGQGSASLPLLLSPACPRLVVLLLPLHLLGSRTETIMNYYT